MNFSAFSIRSSSKISISAHFAAGSAKGSTARWH
jgi:hypothetical protein